MDNIIKKELDQELTIVSNEQIADKVFKMRLKGDTSLLTAPGQFINIKFTGFYLRRPISVSDYDSEGLTIIYKVVGQGTDLLSTIKAGEKLMCLMGLGNGFDTASCGAHVLLVGGGVGTPPMYGLAKELLKQGKKVTVVLGFNSVLDVFYDHEFKALEQEIPGSSIEVRVATVDGSFGTKGFVTDCLTGLDGITDYCACGPMPMLKALYRYYNQKKIGQLSFEERMGCGFGACVGCSISTNSGFKKVCKDGPVFSSDEVIL